MVRQPNTNYIMVEPVYEKHVEAEDRQVQLLSLAKGNVMMLSSGYNDGEELEEGKVYINVKKVVSLPTIMNIRVVNSVVVQYVAVKSAVVEDMSGVPLSLTRESVTRDSSDYSDREEVLAKPEMRLVVFPPAQKQKKYEVAEQKGEVEYIVKIGKKDKMVKLGRRCEESCKMQQAASSNSCPRGVLDGNKCHQSSSIIVIICKSRQCAPHRILVLYRVPEQRVSTQSEACLL